MITSLLFFPEKEMFETPGDYGMPFEDVYPVTSDHVRLHGWYFPAPDAKEVLLFLHGNAGNISGRLHKAKGWFERGVSVLLLDYRGYGQSDGVIERGEHVVVDAQAGLDWLVNQKKWAMNHVFLCGESLGSYPATMLASKHPVGGLLLEAPFTAFTDLARIHYPALPPFMIEKLLKEFRFDNLSLISKIKAPLFIVHGTDDQTCPFAMGQKLFESAPEPKNFLKVLNSGHNNLCECAGKDFWDKPKLFFKITNQSEPTA